MNHQSNRSLYISYIQLILAQLCIGINITTGKFLAKHLSLYSMLEIRFLIGTIVLSTMLLMQKKHYVELQKLKSLGYKMGLCLFVQALCGGFLFNFFLLKGLAYTSATYAGAITSLVPFLVALFSVIFLKERLGIIQILALLLSMAGMFIMFYHDLDSNIAWYGILLLLLSVLPEALFTVLGRYTTALLPPIVIAVLVNIINMLLFIPGTLQLDFHQEMAHIFSDLRICGMLFIYGLSGGALFFLFWYKGLSRVTASIAGAFTSLMPIFTIGLAIIFLGEASTIYHWMGTAIIVLALLLIAKEGHKA